MKPAEFNCSGPENRQASDIGGYCWSCKKSGTLKKFLSGSFYIFVILLTFLACFAQPVCGKAGQVNLDALDGDGTEYSSADVPKAIPDNGTTTSTLEIVDTGAIIDLNVKLNISHTWDGNLDIFLIAPDGTRVELFTDVGGMSNNFNDTILDDEASVSIVDEYAPFAGSYRPEGTLADFKNKEMAGTWILEVTDDWTGETGTLNSWSLIIENEVCQLDAPVIQGEPNMPGGMYDTIVWDDVGKTNEYKSNVPEDIPEQGTLKSKLVIEKVGTIEDLNVKVNITHGWDSELDVFLIAPDNTRVELFTDVGGSQDDFNDTVLDDEASTSITKGTAPFEGSYRPEGSLADLIGKDITGTWTLEVTDDYAFAAGTLNSWSLIVDLADIVYNAQCATVSDFASVLTSSGWMIDSRYTFNSLDPNQEYFYRAKARPLKAWSQTSQADFDKDTLTDTQATSDGDVVLAGGGGPGPELHVIDEPSFESLDPWWADRTSPDILVGSVSELWSSNGSRAGCVVYFYDSYYSTGDYGYLWQTVDWTGVNTLVFDQASFFFGSLLTASVLIGDEEVWSSTGTDSLVDASYGITVDVSAFTGQQDLKLKARANVSGWFDAGMAWDNLRTYGPSGQPSGDIVSTPISLDANDTWDILTFNVTIPAKTTLTVDVLPATGSKPIIGYKDVPSGTDLSGLTQKTIRLRANLETDDPEATPALHDWSITYTDASCESEWSNVVSSTQKE